MFSGIMLVNQGNTIARGELNITFTDKYSKFGNLGFLCHIRILNSELQVDSENPLIDNFTLKPYNRFINIGAGQVVTGGEYETVF